MGKVKLWLKNAATKIKENLPGVIRNYPYSSVALFVLGMMTDWALRFIF